MARYHRLHVWKLSMQVLDQRRLETVVDRIDHCGRSITRLLRTLEEGG